MKGLPILALLAFLLLLIGFAHAQTSIGEFVVGGKPTQIAVDERSGYAFVIVNESNKLARIDPLANEVKFVATGLDPVDLAINTITGTVYVTNYLGKTVTVVDAKTLSTSTVSVDSFPNSVDVNERTNRIYISSDYSGKVTVLDGSTLGANTIYIDNLNMSAEVTVDEATNRIFIGKGSLSFEYGGFFVIDGVTNGWEFIETQTEVTTDIDIDNSRGRVYVVSLYGPLIEFDRNEHKYREIDLSGSTSWSIAVDSAQDKVFVAAGRGKGVVVIDPTTLIQGKIAEDTYPFSVVFNGVTNRVYSGQCGRNCDEYFVQHPLSRKISVIDTVTSTVINTMTAGLSPHRIALNRKANLIYVANGGGDTVSVFDGGSVSVAGKLVDAAGRGIRAATVSISHPIAGRRSVLTSSLGYFQFDRVSIGIDYTANVSSKRFRFGSQALSLTSDVDNLMFVGAE